MADKKTVNHISLGDKGLTVSKLSIQQKKILSLAYAISECLTGFPMAHYKLAQGIYWIGGIPLAGGVTYKESNGERLKVTNPGLFERTPTVKSLRASLSRSCSTLVDRGLLEFKCFSDDPSDPLPLYFLSGYQLTEPGLIAGRFFSDVYPITVDLQTAIDIQLEYDRTHRNSWEHNKAEAVDALIRRISLLKGDHSAFA